MTDTRYQETREVVRLIDAVLEHVFTRSPKSLPLPRKPNGFWDSQPLGELPDKELAARLGVTRTAVSCARWARKIPAYGYQKPHPDIDWDSQPLGRIPDTTIAAELGVAGPTVWEQRRKRGIPPAPESTRRSSGRKQVDVDWDEQPLGELSDVVIAEVLGVASTTVRNARCCRGIPVSPRGGRGKLPPRRAARSGNKPVVDWDSQPLGEVPDTAIAESLGVSCTTVGLTRKKRGIPVFRRRRLRQPGRGGDSI